MRFRRMAAVMAACGALAACGSGNSLPQGTGSSSTTNPDGTVDLPGTPVQPGDGTTDPTEAPETLWPLTQGSTWTYSIVDPMIQGSFQKTVRVVGARQVEGTQMTAMLVHSQQDRTATTGDLYEEYSYQLELTDGRVVRLREEDHKNGSLLRVTTWSPATVKSLSRAPASVPWEQVDAVRELITYPDGSSEDKDPTYAWKVVALNETVTTKAGTFTNAIKVQRDKLNDEGEVKDDKRRTYWLVPGVGKVLETGERTEELVSYDVKPR